MKVLIAAFVLLCVSCSQTNSDKKVQVDTNVVNVNSPQQTVPVIDPTPTKTEEPVSPGKMTYSNKRFRKVIVVNTGNDTYDIHGEAQIFEASFSWVVEDGHNELKKGYEMTDAGAPEWGKFKFTVNIKKANPNSTLHLILFEISAEDGRRQHELPIPLP